MSNELLDEVRLLRQEVAGLRSDLGGNNGRRPPAGGAVATGAIPPPPPPPPPPIPESDWLTVLQAVEIIGCCAKTVREYCRDYFFKEDPRVMRVEQDGEG